MPFQDIIQNLLIENSFSQQQLADVLGVDQTTVGQWLSGKKKPSYDSILAIYEKFNITPNELFGIER